MRGLLAGACLPVLTSPFMQGKVLCDFNARGPIVGTDQIWLQGLVRQTVHMRGQAQFEAGVLLRLGRQINGPAVTMILPVFSEHLDKVFLI